MDIKSNLDYATIELCEVGSDNINEVLEVDAAAEVEESKPWLSAISSDLSVSSEDTDDKGILKIVTSGAVLKQHILCKCLVCNETFNDRYSLIEHNVSHMQICLQKCDNIVYTDDSTYSKQNRMWRECFVCKKVISCRSWNTHMKDFHTTVTCTLCGKEYKSDRNYQKHLKFVHFGMNRNDSFKHPVGEYKCDQCDAVFEHISPLSTHIRNVHSTAVTCKICKSKLKSNSYLLTHMKRVHYDDGKSHVCAICNKSFKSPRYVKVHLKNSHPQEGGEIIAYDKLEHSVQCRCCNESFETNKDLFDHVRDDPDKLKINNLCYICKRRFKNAQAFSKHCNNKHKGAREYNCDCCNVVFSDYFSLEKHKVLDHVRLEVSNDDSKIEIKIEYADDTELVTEENPLEYNVAIREIKLEEM